MSAALRLAVCSLACSLAAAAAPALAAGPSVSYSTWILSGRTVILRYRLAVADAERLTGADVPVLTVSKLGAYVLGHTGVAAQGRACPAADQGYDLGKVDPLEVGAGLYGFEIFFQCAEPLTGELELDDRAMFERVPAHVDFARIEIGRRFIDELFTSGRERLRIPVLAAAAPAGIARYARLGAAHLRESPDRLCFLLGALLIVRRRRELAGIVVALAGGYGLAFLAQAAGLLAPQTPLIEAFVGALVALNAALLAMLGRQSSRVTSLGWPGVLAILAIAALAMRAPRPALLAAGTALFSAGVLALRARSGGGRAVWLLGAAALGFLDGFELPALIAPIDPPAGARALMSLGYDLGALGAAAALIALAAGAFALLRAAELVPSRRICNDLAAACLGCLGAFWFVSRLHL